MGSLGLAFTAGIVSWGIETVFAALLLARLYFLRLQGVYRIFVVYLIAEITGFFAFLTSSLLGSIDYRVWFLWSRPLYWFLYIAMVYALARVIMRSFPGVYRFSRHVLRWSFIAAAAVGGAVFVLDMTPKPNATTLHVLTDLATSLERSFVLTALLLLAGVLGFLLWFPVQVPRNLAVFSGAYIVFFTLTVVTLFARDFLPQDGDSATYVARSVEITSVLCYCWWLFTLSKAGEHEPVRGGRLWKPADQAKLMDKLQAINEALLTIRDKADTSHVG